MHIQNAILNSMNNQLGHFSPPPLPGSVPPISGQDGPLAEMHYAMIRQSVIGRSGVDRTARTARISGNSILVIGILSVLLSLLSLSISALLVTGAICVVGLVELRGARRLKKADPSACTMLGINQLAFLAVIIVYCVLQMFTPPAEIKSLVVSNETRQLMPQMQELNRMVTDIDRIAMPVYYGFYGLVIVLSAAFQGGLALYYFGRRKLVEAYLQSTPAWIQRLSAEMNA